MELAFSVIFAQDYLVLFIKYCQLVRASGEVLYGFVLDAFTLRSAALIFLRYERAQLFCWRQGAQAVRAVFSCLARSKHVLRGDVGDELLLQQVVSVFVVGRRRSRLVL